MIAQETAKKPRRTAKKNPGPQHSLESLTKTADINLKEYLHVQRTDTTYEGYLKRGKEFLAKTVLDRRAAGIDICEEGIKTNELEKAFDTTAPNKYSAAVVAAFITQKCFAEGLSDSYAYGIHAAFCRYWDAM